MIVSTLPRSGGTKFCMDLAEEHNLEYFGELCFDHTIGYDHKFVSLAEHKNKNHEIPNCQPVRTPFDFMRALSKHNKYVIQSNIHSPITLLPFADYFLLRKNFHNMVKSWFNFIVDTVEQRDDADAVFSWMLPNMIDRFGKYTGIILDYCRYNHQEITWYEDLYSTSTYYVKAEKNHRYSKVLDLIHDTSEKYDLLEKYQLHTLG